jgi:hypothetical protein
MVLAADRVATDIAGAVVRSYARLGCTVVETPLADLCEVSGIPGTVVVAADLGVAECVLTLDDDPVDLASGLERLAAVGWEVTLLAPAARMGEAHQALRGRPLFLQAWWYDGDHLCFGASEVP